MDLLKCFSEDINTLQSVLRLITSCGRIYTWSAKLNVRLWDQSAQAEAMAALLDVGHRTC